MFVSLCLLLMIEPSDEPPPEQEAAVQLALS